MATFWCLTLALSFVAVSGVCRDGWVRFHGSCYLFRETPNESWHDAKVKEPFKNGRQRKSSAQRCLEYKDIEKKTKCFGNLGLLRLIEGFDNQKNYCSAIKAHLVQIDDKAENDFIKAEIRLLNMGFTDSFWTDGTDMDAEGVWMWSTSQTRIEQTFWTPGEPNSVNSTSLDEDCINLPVWQQLQWNDESCARTCSFVCEIEDDGSVNVIG